jgi:large subunit ribosomal protein L4
MKLDVTSLDGASGGSIELSDAVFGLKPRADLIARMVQWQLAKRRAGSAKTLGRADIARTGKKMYKQKGTGGARHGSARRRCVRWRCVMRSRPRRRRAS